MSRTRVLLVGAAGETGGSIANGLLENPVFELYALVRPRSVQKPAIVSLQERGVQIRKCDLKGSEETLANALQGIDVVISCVGPAEQQDQIPLAKAAKKVGVKRFVPCGFITVAPPGGIMWLRDEVRPFGCTLPTFYSLPSRPPEVTGAKMTSYVNVSGPYRKKRSTTTLSNSTCPTPSSMSVGGTSSHTLVLNLVGLTTP
jgi:hypothetical protein